VDLLRRLTHGAFYGSGAKLAERVEGPVTRRTPLTRERFRSLFGGVMLFWSSRRVLRALRAALKK
jgi:hypothetical protein